MTRFLYVKSRWFLELNQNGIISCLPIIELLIRNERVIEWWKYTIFKWNCYCRTLNYRSIINGGAVTMFQGWMVLFYIHFFLLLGIFISFTAAEMRWCGRWTIISWYYDVSFFFSLLKHLTKISIQPKIALNKDLLIFLRTMLFAIEWLWFMETGVQTEP